MTRVPTAQAETSLSGAASGSWGARERLIQLRRKEFTEQSVEPLPAEAERLAISTGELTDLIGQTPKRPEDQ